MRLASLHLPPGRGSFGLLLAVTLLAASAGCGSGRSGQVSGKVLYGGKPVLSGDVNFLSKGKGVGAIARIDGSGNFTLGEHLEPGTYTVYVTPPAELPQSPGAGAAVKDNRQDIPTKARDPGTSGVVVTVKKGRNDFVIELAE